MKHTVNVVLLLLFSISLFSQNATIKGITKDQAGEALPFVNILLYSSKDSSMVKGEVSDDSGVFYFASVSEGEYWIESAFIGYTTMTSDIIKIEEGQKIELEPYIMKTMSTQLSEIVVKTSKPMIEVHADKTVFNVADNVNAAGENGLELLRKAPGVVVDNNDAILLMGKSGVQIYIDGKPSPYSADDLADYLKTVQASEVEAIEIITNPSAKFDAEGNGGIINIKFKKDKNLGANANLDIGFADAVYDQYTGKISGNYREKEFNVFGSYGIYDGGNWNYMNLRREQLGTFYDQVGSNEGTNTNHSFRLGSDFFLSDKSTLGFLVNGNISNGGWGSNSRTEIGSLGNPFETVLSAGSQDVNDKTNFNFNVNYKFDTGKGKVWNIDADYGTYDSDRSATQPNYYYDRTETILLDERSYFNETPSKIDIYTFKVDHEFPMLGGSFGTGVKFALVETDNTFDVYNMFEDKTELDIDRSNTFGYSENVNAAYVTFTKKVNKFGYNLGLRMEQTNSEGDLVAMKVSNNENVDRSYVNLFPSGGMTYQAGEQTSLRLNYSRRIKRPNYQDLNPFENKLDELTFQKGNPFLNPEYSHSVEFTHSYKYRYNTTISYSYSTDLITRITDTAGTAAFITWLNLAEQHNIALSFSAPVQIKKWWQTFTNISGYRTHNIANYDEGKQVDLKAHAFNVYSQHSFLLPWDLKMQISGWYNSPALWGGTFKMKGMGAMDIGVNKQILDGRGKINVSVSDVLKTNKWSGESQFGVLYLNVNGGRDSRRLKLNFSYLLGNSQVKKSRKRSTGLEDESSRVQ